MRILRNMRNLRRAVAVFLAALMFGGPGLRDLAVSTAYAQPVNPPRTSSPLKPLVEELLAATSDANDTDGLPDSVEAVIGTDPNNADTDFDRLDDYSEATNDTDSLDPDTNHNGLPDYLEVKDPNLADTDGDGIDNAWDFDNDGDGVNDGVDLSPFALTDVNDNFHFDIFTGGNPSYITLQLRPANPEHLNLFGKYWDWPDGDHEGTMQDRDHSKEDIAVFPLLELTVNVLPEQSVKLELAESEVLAQNMQTDKEIVLTRATV